MMRSKFFILIFFSGIIASLSQTYSFDNYTVEQGLSQSNISAVVQDKQGYLWLGTGSGVSRFDGKNFRNYSTDDGLHDNNITAILRAKDESLWFADANGGLTVYRDGKFTAVASDALPKDKKIFSLFEAKDGSIWFGAAQSGATQIKNPLGDLSDKSNYAIYKGKEGLSEFVFDIEQDAEGTLYFLTDVGIKTFKNGKFEFFRAKGMPFMQITAFMKDKKGNFWFGTVNGTVSVCDFKSNSCKNFNSANGLPASGNMVGGITTLNFVTEMFEDSKGRIWISVWDGGVCMLNPGEAVKDSSQLFTVFNTEKGISVNKIKAISEDREGNMLFGTYGAGLAVYKGEKFISWSKRNGLINNQVWAIVQDRNGKYWFGTNEGISVFNPAETNSDKAFENFEKIDGLLSNSVRAMKEDKDGNIWIGTWGGKACMYDAKKKQFATIPSLMENMSYHVSCVEIDKKGNIWFGTVEGIAVYSPGTRETKVFRTIDGLSENDITCIYADSKNNIWIGTKQRGITKYDGKRFTKLGKPEGLAYNSITCITEGKKNSIWIGTEGGGVYLYDGKNFLNYKSKDGLVSDFITLLTVDAQNNLWLGTNKGLNRFDYNKNLFYAYGKYDGFTGIETKSNAVLKDNAGNIWFGTVNGVYRYSPRHDVINNLEPVILLTKLRVNLKDYPLTGEKIELDYKDNNLNFDFIGISLSNPEEVEYIVKMDGFDETWKPASKQAFEIYSNLPPGEYKFNVRACNNSNICSENAASVSIYINPPFYKTWWFYVLVTVIGVTVIFSYIKVRERNLRKEKAVLEEKVKERTAEVEEKNLELSEKNKDIMDSIRYAKRIQDAILPPDDYVRNHLPKTFILFKPKDIVSGDFYWVNDKQDKVLFAAVDCTGHGVPGAFMSIVGHNMLEKIVGEDGITKPSEILFALNKSVSDTLRQSHIEEVQVKDGMDITICCFDRKTNLIEFAGAMNPLYFIRNGELKEIKGDKFPIGGLKAGEVRKFTNHELPLQPGDTLYVFTDGFADQFGGPMGKKFKYQHFKNTLLGIQHLPMEEQGAVLDKVINEWRGNLEQVDDILVIGTRL